jgi:hypothetical protein
VKVNITPRMERMRFSLRARKTLRTVGAAHCVHTMADGIILSARFVLDVENRSGGMRISTGSPTAVIAGRFFSRKRLNTMNRGRSVSRTEDVTHGESSYGLMPEISKKEITSGAGGVPSKAPTRAFLGWFFPDTSYKFTRIWDGRGSSFSKRKLYKHGLTVWTT